MQTQLFSFISLFVIIICTITQLSVAKSTRQCPCETQELCNTVKNTTRREVFLFSLHDTKATWLRYDWSKVTTVIMVGYFSSELMCYAHKHDVRVVTIGNIPVANLTSSAARTAWVKEHLEIVQDNFLDGINIDFEDPIPRNRTDLKNALNMFVKETYDTFKKALSNYQVTVDVAWSPPTMDNCIDERCYDVAYLASVSDFLFVMAYDEQSQITGECVAAANSGYYKTLSGLQGYLKFYEVPYHKIVLGVPWYGYKYECVAFNVPKCHIAEVPFRGVNCSDAAGKQIDFHVTIAMVDDSTSGRIWDADTQTPFFYQRDIITGEYYEVWYDDPQSLALKYQMAERITLRGVGVWNVDCLDYSDTPFANKWRIAMWDKLPKYPR